MKKVYAAGPISGLTFEDCSSWRKYAQRELARVGITVISPLRAKEYLSGKGKLSKEGYTGKVLSCSKGITTRDRWDCTHSDVVLFNLLGAKEVSIGTIMELAWADSFRVPSVVVMEKEGNVHDHSIVNECTGFRVETLEEGLEIVKAMFTYEEKEVEPECSFNSAIEDYVRKHSLKPPTPQESQNLIDLLIQEA